MPSHNPEFEGKKMGKKKIAKKVPARKARRSSKTRTEKPPKVYFLSSCSREYGAARGWPVAEEYVSSGQSRSPNEGEVYLDSAGEAWFASFDFESERGYEILVPREVKAPKKARKA